MNKLSILLSSATLFLVACGVEESEDIVIHVPEATVIEKPVIVKVPVPAPVSISTPAPKKTVCHVLLTDRHGNVSRLSVDDLFLRSSELARKFPEAEANLLIKNKQCKVAGELSKYCWTE
jgi:hypothetical protein